MRIKTLFILLTSLSFGILVAFLGSLWAYQKATMDVSAAYKAEYDSYLLADELRQSSDDLTRLVRTYVATGEESFKAQYNDVLDIRNGKKPRPEAYYRVYWDFVAAGDAQPRATGETIALRDLMKQTGFTEAEFKLLDEAAGKSDGLVALEVQAMKLVEKGASTTKEERDQAISLVNSADYHRFKSEIMKPIDDFYVALDIRLRAQIATAEQAAAFNQAIMFGATAALVLILCVFGVILFRNVINGVSSLQIAMTEISRNNLNCHIPGSDRVDEIGEMAGALEVFRLAAIENRRLEAEAATVQSHAEADRMQLAEAAEAAAQQRLREATSGLASGLKRLAAGDLAFQIDVPFSAEFEGLRQDLNSAIAQLGRTLALVSVSTESIDGGSREISGSADNLSRRTEQQAASLEETAAALDEITVNVTNSSKRADEARLVAKQANESAAQSGSVVATAVDAMQRIEQSSSQISNIIGVIDEIAFQTNLLALNAGVEAARAGEAGKGFAVVAQEVRELAQRSAQAAKEIKNLILTSSQEVASGVKLVSDTGKALKTIEGFIVTINNHMDAIATSAREQSVGLAEVNTAVNQMDQVTQQNAAMVEETNAAASTLANESARLRELIGQFRVETAESAPAAARGQHSSPKARQHAPAAFQGNAALKDWREF